ncbi:hypothetical protein FIBSPDRAFT_962437 [Athelia psychrophila]|uniref:Nephrocystin 3-like N-terminal domain-containing protein n=1 Tax=Athelia psychrophila TaxID=1759441 RepID=A0A166A3S2_9AGAM|nr:hypothetical protein FIBSPDRAFT_962437 [Fibularhizoctonia sp. CBS 109695]
MSNRPETSSSASPERIDRDSIPDQQSSHGQSEGLGTEKIQITPISKAIFNTQNTSGPVTNVNGNIYYENSAPAPNHLNIDLDYSGRARFDCEDRTSCTERTRIDVIEKIETWTDNGPPVFWLNGSAGTGKSTIAFTVAKSFKGRGILGASFFCSRDDATCSNQRLIFPTIAHQLAHFHPEFRRRLADVVKEKPDIVHSDVAYQLQVLIVQPLSCIRDFPSNCVIVIDALDECKGDSTISVILTALSRHVEKLAPLKIFLTSRPERNINLGFSDSILHGTTRRFILHEIKLSTVEADIKTCIVAQLDVVRREYGIDQSWPFDAEVDSLSALSCGLFIFAATAIKFIQDRNYDNPQEQLTRIILNATPLKDEDSDPLHRLDQLYMQVLMNAHPKPSSELAERLRLLLGTIVLLQDPLSFHGIQQLLKHEPVNLFEVQSMRQTLMRLHSIILVPEDDNAVIRTLHPSFFDFITSPDRCSISRLLVDTSQQHTLLLAACLRTMQDLKRNICELPDPSVLNSEVVDLSSRIVNFIPPAQQYACRHWGTHLRYAVLSQDIRKLLLRFCSKYMLFWVEACSLMGDLRNQLIILDGAQQTLTKYVHQDSATAMTLLHDCGSLIRNFFPAVSTAWAHVYDSALTFVPQGSALRKCYSSQIKMMGGQQESNTCWRIIEGHSSLVCSVVYSPNGTRIASGSIDRTIRLWDAISGAHLNTLEGNSNSACSVAFSPDGATIASGSDYHTVLLWDTVTGKRLLVLEGHLETVRSVAYSPNGTRIASGSLDRTIRLWDALSGAHLNTLEGHSSSVHSVAFSPDGAVIVSGSLDKTIRLWNAVSGKHLVTLDGHIGAVKSVAYSPDGTRIASGSEDCTIRIWDCTNWKHQKTLKGHRDIVSSVAFSSDSTTIVSASEDRTIRLWDTVSGESLVTLEGHSGGVNSASFSPAGTRVASGSDDDTIRLWITGEDIRPKKDSKKTSPFLRAFSRLKITRGLARPDHISDADSHLFAFSPNDSIIVSFPLAGSPVLWNAVTGVRLITLTLPLDRVLARYGVNGVRLKPLTWYLDRVTTIAFSHDGTKIVAVPYDSETPRLLDIARGTEMEMLNRHEGPVLSVAFSPDDTRIASGSEDSTTRLWDVVNGANVHILKGHHGPVVYVKFSPEGTRIASGSASDILLWDVLHGTPLVTVSCSMTANRDLRSIAFAPDGNFLVAVVSYGGNCSLELRDLEHDGKQLKVIQSHKASPALWLPFSPEHRDLATDENSTRQWAQASGKIKPRIRSFGTIITRGFTGPNDKYDYFLQDGWVWLVHPRRRLCWVPLACRGPTFLSSNTRIAFGTEHQGIVIIDFSDILESSSLQAQADQPGPLREVRKYPYIPKARLLIHKISLSRPPTDENEESSGGKPG